MKKFTCYDCAMQFDARARDTLLHALHDHYMKDHYEIITGVNEAEKKAWMERFQQDWENTQEV